MGRHLIVANQTVGGAELEAHLRARIAEGVTRFYVVVPATPPDLEAAAWASTNDGAGDDDDDDAPPEHRSLFRLTSMLETLTALGGEAAGEVGDPDPVLAIRAVLEREDFDEIIVSTLPVGLSRWLRMDLPSRLARLVDCPVVVVEAEGR